MDLRTVIGLLFLASISYLFWRFLFKPTQEVKDKFFDYCQQERKMRVSKQPLVEVYIPASLDEVYEQRKKGFVSAYHFNPTTNCWLKKVEASSLHNSNSIIDSSINQWIIDLSLVEGDVVDVAKYNKSALSIKFKSGNCYTIGISKQSQVTLD
jgi:hypothetical protein